MLAGPICLLCVGRNYSAKGLRPLWTPALRRPPVPRTHRSLSVWLAATILPRGSPPWTPALREPLWEPLAAGGLWEPLEGVLRRTPSQKYSLATLGFRKSTQQGIKRLGIPSNVTIFRGEPIFFFLKVSSLNESHIQANLVINSRRKGKAHQDPARHLPADKSSDPGLLPKKL